MEANRKKAPIDRMRGPRWDLPIRATHLIIQALRLLITLLNLTS